MDTWTITVTITTDDDTAEDVRDAILDLLDQDRRPLRPRVVATNSKGQTPA